MADTNIKAMLQGSKGAVQDTGNPVFDATVNIFMNSNVYWNLDAVEPLHNELLKIYEREPRKAPMPQPKSRSLQKMADSSEEIGAR